MKFKVNRFSDDLKLRNRKLLVAHFKRIGFPIKYNLLII